MTEPQDEKNEAKLEQIAKKLLSTKPKPRQDMKKGEEKKKRAQSK